MNTSVTYSFNTLYQHTSILFFMVLFVCFSPSPLQAATVVNNGFESGNLSGLVCSGNCPVVTTSPIRTGKYSGNFNLTRTMKTSYRTEAHLGNAGAFQFGKEYWVEFNYRYEDWEKDTDAEIAPFQIHATPSSWDASCNIGAAVSKAPFLMVSQNDEVKFVTYGGKVLWRAALQKKQWLNMSVHFRISTGSDGFVEAWKDGIKIGRVNGLNSPKVDKCGKPMLAPYFKMGVYKWNWSAFTTQSSRRQLIIDDLKVMTLN
jgi:hypothetical protein